MRDDEQMMRDGEQMMRDGEQVMESRWDEQVHCR